MLSDLLAGAALTSRKPGALASRLEPLQGLIRSLVPATVAEEDGDLHPELFGALAEAGLFRLMVPADCGGLGASTVDFVHLMEELGRLGPAWAITAVPHLCISVAAVDRLAAGPLRSEVLGGVADQHHLLAFAVTEDSGSDLAALGTTLSRTPDGSLVLSGRKQWVTNLRRASHVTVMARCPGLHPMPGATQLVLVPLAADGVHPSAPWEKLAARGSDTGDLYLQDVAVAPEWLMGQPGEGFHHFHELVLPGRLGAGAAALGLAGLALDLARQEDCLDDSSLDALASLLQGARASLAWAAEGVDGQDPDRADEVALAKELAGRVAQEVADALDEACAAQGRRSPPALRRACEALGLFRLLKGPGDLLALQAVLRHVRKLGEESALAGWPPALAEALRRLRQQAGVLESRPLGRHPATLQALGAGLACLQVMAALPLEASMAPWLERLEAALEGDEPIALEASGDPRAPSAEAEEVDELTRLLHTQMDAILPRHGGDVPACLGALEALGLRDPEALPPVCAHSLLRSLGGQAPEIAAQWEPASRGEAQALRAGLLRRLVSDTERHARSRIMFSRSLADQPAVRHRLDKLQGLLHRLEIQDGGPAPELRQWAREIRNEAQQIAGGTGYMKESAVARTLLALRRVEDRLRPLEAELALEVCS